MTKSSYKYLSIGERKDLEQSLNTPTVDIFINVNTTIIDQLCRLKT